MITCLDWAFDFLSVVISGKPGQQELKTTDLQISMACIQECFNFWNFDLEETSSAVISSTNIFQEMKIGEKITREEWKKGQISKAIINVFKNQTKIPEGFFLFLVLFL